MYSIPLERREGGLIYDATSSWKALNLAEYYIWSAIRFRFGHVLPNPHAAKVESEQDKATARYFLKVARDLRAVGL